MNYYLHTVDNEPAFFDGDQLVKTNKISLSSLPTYLKAMKKEQELSTQFRKDRFKTASLPDYGYVLLRDN